MPEMTPLEARLTKEVEALRQENKLLREKIDLLVRRVFGASSERLDRAEVERIAASAAIQPPMEWPAR